MKTIVVAVDGSDIARKATDWAAALAGPAKAELLLVHCIVPVVYPAYMAFPSWADLEAIVAKDAEAMLAAEAKRVNATGLKVRTEVARGPAAETIAEIAVREAADLVVVGSHGRGVVGRVLLGSVAHRLLQLCARPVTVVR